MPASTKKFDNVRATRLTLILSLSLIAGLSTAIFMPALLSPQAQTTQAQDLAFTQVPAGVFLRHRSGREGVRR